MGKCNLVTKACGIFLFWAATVVTLPAQTTAISSSTPIFTTLHSFDATDGATPEAGLVQGADGNLYGTTAAGGGGAVGDGTVFRIALSGAVTTLYSFCPNGYPCSDGSQPRAPLVQGTGGNFYGTTFVGGGANNFGTVFKITATGTLTTLYNFCSQGGNECTDGAQPEAPLVQGADGNFYGTTASGTATCPVPIVCGTVFKIIPSGALTTLNSFDGKDGMSPYAGLVQGTNGDFYGTTFEGGAFFYCNYGDGCGTVFKVTTNGTLTTLHSFHGSEGIDPAAGLVQGTDGYFYGTTQYGGTHSCYNLSCGTVFRITPNGSLTTLHNFDGADGGLPNGLVQGTDGNFYGTTFVGGTNTSCEGGSGCGTIFRITPSGKLTTLYNFCSKGGYPNCSGGSSPEGTLVQDTNGIFYGTTYFGGNSNCGFDEIGCGSVFSISVGLSPFVETNPTAGKVGAKVGILGTDLTGATNVTFNGTTAAFKVVSKTLIAAKVPSGATTDTVQVELPSGTLSSNVPFIVLR